MSRTFDGVTGQTLTFLLPAAITTFPITILAKFKDTEGTATHNDRCIVDFTTDSGIEGFIRFGRNEADQRLRLASRFQSSSPAMARSTGSYTTNTWSTAAAEIISETSQFVRLEGVRGPEGTSNIPGAIATGNLIRISIGYERNSSTDEWDGGLAEIAIYENNLLTDQQHTDYVNGKSPFNINPDDLLAYVDMVRGVAVDGTGNQIDFVSGDPFVAENNPGYDSDHPVMIDRIIAGFINSIENVFTPTISLGGSLEITVPFIASVETIFSPTVSAGDASAITPGVISSVEQVFSPTVVLLTSGPIDVPFIASNENVFDPIVSAGDAPPIAPTLVSSDETVYTALVSPGSAPPIEAPLIPSTETLFAPTVAAGDAPPITVPFVPGVEQVFTPAVFDANAAVGYLKGELSIYPPYNGALKVVGGYIGTVEVFNGFDGKLKVL